MVGRVAWEMCVSDVEKVLNGGQAWNAGLPAFSRRGSGAHGSAVRPRLLALARPSLSRIPAPPAPPPRAPGCVPQELRVKGSYLHHKSIRAAMGVKIAAHNLESAVAGTQVGRAGAAGGRALQADRQEDRQAARLAGRQAGRQAASQAASCWRAWFGAPRCSVHGGRPARGTASLTALSCARQARLAPPAPLNPPQPTHSTPLHSTPLHPILLFFPFTPPYTSCLAWHLPSTPTPTRAPTPTLAPATAPTPSPPARPQLYVVGPEDDVEAIKEEVMEDMTDIFSSVDKSGGSSALRASLTDIFS